MKIYTNENNTATLKLLIAAKLAGKDVELLKGTYEEAPGPAVLPRLEVHEELSFFSSNAAVQYLFPVLDLSQNGQCQQMQEWEATRLQPVVTAVVTSKTVSSELKEGLNSLLLVVDRLLSKQHYILGDKLTPADISIYSTLYPLSQSDLKSTYLTETSHVVRWTTELGSARAVQEAIQQWGGSPGAPPVPSPLGALPALALSPAGSPDEAPAGPTAEELELARDNFTNGLKYLQAPLKREKVILPLKDRKNVLITSALPYVNNVPHLGNIIGCVLSADIFARYCRLCDYNTLFVCGTDEYGTATETKALEEGVSPREVCDKYHRIHADVYSWFNIDFDYFGRTSTDEQTTIAQNMFTKLNANGFVSKQTVEQLYCERCTRFLADRFVEGTCPHPGCLSPDARGDQCDRCGKLINATELKDPRCKQCGGTPAIRNSDQLFIDLPLLEPSLRTWSLSAEASWSGPARGVLRAWQREPLRARAVTRDLQWGVPVPLANFTHKVFYVWFDAPIGYLSITQCATGRYERWWRRSPDYDVKLYQFMAKDNVPFHAIMFPATVMGVNDGHLLVDHIFATEYLNYEDSKFSKSRGVGVFGTDAQDTGIAPDVWRFYLAAIRPETSDSIFSWSDLVTRNNSELLNNLGNFCHRSLSFCYSTYGGAVPGAALQAGDLALLAACNRDVAGYVQYMSKGRLREALRLVLSVSRAGNLYMQERQPWTLTKGGDSEREKAATTISVCCQLVALLATLLAPFMPDTSRRLSHQLNIDHGALRLNPDRPSVVLLLPPGHRLNKPEPLFTKIEPAAALALRDKYAGTQTNREQGAGAQGAPGVAQGAPGVAQGAPGVAQGAPGVAQGAPGVAQGAPSVAALEAAAAHQGEIVRKLKASTRDKSVWQPEVKKLLEFKKLLADARSPRTQTNTHVGGQEGNTSNVTDLEKAIAEQGDKVRKLKASTKDKSVWQPEVNKLLDLKKQLTTAQAQTNTRTDTRTNRHTPDTVEGLQQAINAQGYKLLDLQQTNRDQSVFDSEVKVLNDLKKQLLTLQAENK